MARPAGGHPSFTGRCQENWATNFCAGIAADSLSHDCSGDGDNRRNFSALADAKHSCTARWTDALGGGFTVFHGDGFSIFHLFLRPAFDAVCLHSVLLDLYSPSRIADTRLKRQRPPVTLDQHHDRVMENNLSIRYAASAHVYR